MEMFYNTKVTSMSYPSTYISNYMQKEYGTDKEYAKYVILKCNFSYVPFQFIKDLTAFGCSLVFEYKIFFVRNNILRMFVYFSSLDVDVVEQQKSYTFNQFVGK